MIAYLILAALVFGVCFLVDKGFSKLFRGKTQHSSGLAVRLSKRFALFGLLLMAVGTLSIVTGITQSSLLLIGGIFVLLIGLGLAVHYLTFGIFYDDDTFLQSAFGRKSVVRNFRDIVGQQLYVVQGGNVIVELHMADGSAVGIQSSMDGAVAFLDHAFAAWCRLNGRAPESCEFHDPAGNRWFPGIQEEA